MFTQAEAPGCEVCGCKDKVLVCGRCRVARYCGAAHQRQHWKIHKTHCKPATDPRPEKRQAKAKLETGTKDAKNSGVVDALMVACTNAASREPQSEAVARALDKFDLQTILGYARMLVSRAAAEKAYPLFTFLLKQIFTAHGRNDVRLAVLFQCRASVNQLLKQYHLAVDDAMHADYLLRRCGLPRSASFFSIAQAIAKMRVFDMVEPALESCVKIAKQESGALESIKKACARVREKVERHLAERKKRGENLSKETMQDAMERVEWIFHEKPQSEVDQEKRKVSHTLVSLALFHLNHVRSC